MSPSRELYGQNLATNGKSDMLSNTSHIDVFAPTTTTVSEPHDDHPDDRKFVDEVVPLAMSATLEPGDMLFFPPGWWHAMKSEEMSFSVSLWF